MHLRHQLGQGRAVGLGVAPELAGQAEKPHVVLRALVAHDSLRERHGAGGVCPTLHALAASVLERGIPDLVLHQDVQGRDTMTAFQILHLRVNSNLHFPLVRAVANNHHVHAPGTERHKDVSCRDNLGLEKVPCRERLGELLRAVLQRALSIGNTLLRASLRG